MLPLVEHSWSNKQVACELAFSPWMISVYLRAIYSKIGVETRAAAARFAIDH